MANRFLNNIKINDEYTLPSADGTADQIITTDGAGQLSFVDQNTVVSGASRTVSILVKNIPSSDGGVNLSKGDPVYIYASVGASERLYVDLADAGDSSKMPCVALLDQDLSPNGEGTATVTGKLKNLITSPIDGATPTENDTIYVKSGGGLTLTKPTGPSNLIQNVGQVGRVSTSSDGNIVVSAILRSNDVPNLTTGKIWVGSTANTTESTVVHLDETNGRMGIGTTSPSQKLDVDGNVSFGIVNKFTTGVNTLYGAGSNGIYLRSAISSAANPSFSNVDDTNTGMFLPGSDVLGLSTAGTERLRITSAGNVGIGTTSPSHKLHVEVDDTSTPALKIQSTNASNQAEIDFQTTGGTGKFELDQAGNMVFRVNQSNMYIDANNASAGIIFRTGGLTERLRINSSGNVGIGTTSPSEKLEVDGNISVLGSFGRQAVYGSSNIKIGGGTASGDRFIDYVMDGNQQWRTGVDDTDGNKFGIAYKNGSSPTLGTDNLMTISSASGNVGIGTTIPSAKLEVEGNVLADAFNTNASSSEISTIQSSSDIPLRVKSTDSFAGIDIKDSSTTASFQGLFAQGNNIGLRTWNTTRLEVNSGGTFTFSGNIISQNGGGHTITLYDNDGLRNNRILMGADANGAFINSSYGSGGKGDLNLISYNLGGVAIGKVSPKAKLDVNGGIRMADDSSSASADNVGTLRYRTSGNNSYVDMCMQTGASTYEWVNIVQNNW